MGELLVREIGWMLLGGPEDSLSSLLQNTLEILDHYADIVDQEWMLLPDGTGFSRTRVAGSGTVLLQDYELSKDSLQLRVIQNANKTPAVDVFFTQTDATPRDESLAAWLKDIIEEAMPFLPL